MRGNNSTDRGKLGTKRHILTDKDGIPLSIVITSANTMMLLLQLMQLTVWLSKDHQHQQIEIRKRCRIYVLLKHIIPKK